jgi:hypothetical protein
VRGRLCRLTSSTGGDAMNLEEFKAVQRQMWAEGDYPRVGRLLEPGARILVESVGVTDGVFAANPSTAQHFLRVLDVAYYLVFSAFVVIETQVVAREEWLGPDGTGVHLGWLARRIGAMLLLMGVLHAVTIATLPVLGVVFSSIWRQLPPEERGTTDASRP